MGYACTASKANTAKIGTSSHKMHICLVSTCKKKFILLCIKPLQPCVYVFILLS